MEFISASEMAKRYQLQLVQRDADDCEVVVIASWWKKLRRPFGDLKALDKLGMDLATSSAAIDLALPPVDSVPPEDFKDLDKRTSTKWAHPPSTSLLRPLILSTRLSGSPFVAGVAAAFLALYSKNKIFDEWTPPVRMPRACKEAPLWRNSLP